MGMAVFLGMRYSEWDESVPVDQVAESVADFIRNGAAALGVGSSLVNQNLLDAGDTDRQDGDPDVGEHAPPVRTVATNDAEDGDLTASIVALVLVG